MKNGSVWDYEYNLKDLQIAIGIGNTRVVIRKGGSGLAEVIQERHYYPFGMLERSGNPVLAGEISELSYGTGSNKYLYNSKEIQNDFDLYWYDYGARFYDPQLGRFHTDPLAEKYPQVSAYAYCENNPIAFRDPSGYSWLSDNWRTLLAGTVGVTVAILTAGTGTAGSIALGQAILSGAAGGFAGGFTGSLLNGGNLGDAVKAGVIGGVIGGISAGAASKVGSFFGHEIGTFQKELARSLAHGSIGGLASMAQGGKFKHGFFAGSFASMAGSGMQASNWGVFQTTAGGTVTAAVVGGTASALGGGKFANGAVTGAYTMLFNHMAAQHQQHQKSPGRADWNDPREVYFKTKEWMKFIAEGNSPVGTDYWNVMDIYENIEYESNWKKFLNSAMKGNTSRSLEYPDAGLRIYVAETNLVENYRANYIQGIRPFDSQMKIVLYGTSGEYQGVIVAKFTNINFYNKWKKYIGIK